MKSKEAWDFAHRYFGKLWFQLGIVLSIISGAMLFLFRGSSHESMGKMASVLMIVQLVLLVTPIIPTEILLKNKFNGEGKPKQ